MRITDDMKMAYEKGYNAGYREGLKDGNPFTGLAEAITKVVDSMSEAMKDPEFLAMITASRDDDKTDSGLLEDE